MLRAISPKNLFAGLLVTLAMSWNGFAQSKPRARWTGDEARAYMERQPYPIGANFVPKDAINQLEMWQADTFDILEIDKELGWAEQIGMTTMRVFLHDLLWLQDSAGFTQRINQFLSVSSKHHIKPIFVLFDSCWDAHPKLGPQHPPIPGVHNSGWVQSPGAALADISQRPRLQAYVVGVVGHFAGDDRILGWDLWNEPDNGGGTAYDGGNQTKTQLVDAMLPDVFSWARSVNPSQPLTSGVWTKSESWKTPEAWSPTAKIQLTESDIITFHSYQWPEDFEAAIEALLPLGRPLLCTEYMARGVGSTFDGSLPIAAKYGVGAVNWGFVQGKEQTELPWDSRQVPYINRKPRIWFHDVFYPDGRPYREAEVTLIKRISDEMNTSQKR